MIRSRIEKIQNHLNQHRSHSHHRNPRPDHDHRTAERYRDQARSRSAMDEDLLTAYVVIKQKPLKDDPLVPKWVKWLLRWVYFRYAWAATGHDGTSYTKLEFYGIYDSAPAARYAAMVAGGSYRELPLNCSLPEESCQFGNYDHPMSDASPDYRHRKMPFVAIPRVEMELLEQKVNQTADCAEGKCVPRAV